MALNSNTVKWKQTKWAKKPKTKVTIGKENGMPIPKPKKNEKQEDFISRTIAFLIEEGEEQDQAAAIAYSTWNDAKGIKKYKIEKSIPPDMSFREIEGAIYQAWNKTFPKTNLSEPSSFYGAIVEVYPDGTCVVSKSDTGKTTYFQYNYSFDDDGSVVLANPIEVTMDWVEKNITEEGPDIIRKHEVGLMKIDEEQGLIWGVALQPDIEDSQGDAISKEEIIKTAHSFMIGYRNQMTHMGEMHKREVKDISVVQSFVVDQSILSKVKDGSWVVVSKVKDPKTSKIWDKVKKGEYSGYSIGGRGKRTPITKLNR